MPTLETIANAKSITVRFCDEFPHYCVRGPQGWEVYYLLDGGPIRNTNTYWLNKPTPHPTDDEILRLVNMANSPDDDIKFE